MALDDEPVVAQIHGLLAEWGDEFPAATGVRGITENRKVGNASAQLDGNVPERRIAVDALIVA